MRVLHLLLLGLFILSVAQAKHFDLSFKHSSHSHHHFKKIFKHKRHHRHHGHDKNKCSKTKFKDWQSVVNSKNISVTQDADSITLTSACELEFERKFSYTATKTLIIEAKALEFKNHSKLFAPTLILQTDKKLSIKKHAKLCADLLVLEVGEKDFKHGQPCASAQVIGSSVGLPSALANLQVEVTMPTAPSEVHFDFSASVGLYDSARLDLGDGTSVDLTDSTFSYTYQNGGSYTVQLYLQTPGGEALSTPQVITLNQQNRPPVLADFNIYERGPAPVNVGFEAWPFASDSDGQIVLYEYTWGDGTSTTTIDGYQDHFYSTAGIFPVSIRVQDNTGAWSDYVTKNITIAENQAPTLTDFNIYDNGALVSVALGAEVWPYSSDSDGYVATYEYNWGDGSIEQDTNGYREHTYSSAGTFQIKVRVQDNLGAWSDFVTKVVTIEINQAPVIAHVPVYGNVNQPAPVHLAFAPWEGTIDDQYIARWTYDFGDGSPLLETLDGYVEHDFIFPGSFNVVITAFDPYGLSSSFTIPIEIKSNQVPTLTDFNIFDNGAIAPVTVGVEAWPFASDSDGFITQYEYNWGDGVVELDQQGYKEHIYANGGDYQIVMRVLDDKGDWSTPITKSITLNANTPPSAQIALLSGRFYAPETLTFSAFQSTDEDGQIVSYKWLLSDGRTFDGQEIDISIDSIGQYSLDLQIIDDKGGVATSQYLFEILSNHAPVAVINASKTEVAAYEVFELDGSASSDIDIGQVLSYTWTFSNGQTYYGEKVFPFFSDSGTYHLVLTVSDDFGGSHSVSDEITVTPYEGPLPTPNIKISGAIGPGGGYRGELNFDASESLAPGDTITSYEWAFSDGNTYSGDYVRRGFGSAGDYTVNLTVRTQAGRAKSFSQTFSLEGLTDPRSAYSKKITKLTSPNPLAIQPLNTTIQFSIEEGSFFSPEEVNLFVNDVVVDHAQLRFISTSIVEADVLLADGVNTVGLRGYDNEENEIIEDEKIYAGSKALALTIIDSDGIPTAGQEVRLYLIENKEIFVDSISNNEGIATFNGLPHLEMLAIAHAENFHLSKIINKDSVSAELISTQIDLAQLDASNLDFSNGIVGWDVEAPNYEVVAVDGETRLRSNIIAGQSIKLKRNFKASRKGFVELPFNLKPIESKGFYYASLVNLTTGEAQVLSGKISADDDSVVEKSLNVAADGNDIIVANYEVYLDAESISFYNKIFDAYAAGAVILESKGVIERKYVFNYVFAERAIDKFQEDSLEGLTKLSIVNFNHLSSGTLYDKKNRIYFNFSVKGNGNIKTARVVNLKMFQDDESNVLAQTSPVDTSLYSETCPGSDNCITPLDKFDEAFSIVVPSSIDFEKPVALKATVQVIYTDDMLAPPIEQIITITPDNFLFAHRWTLNEKHYDENDGGIDDYNLNTPTDAGDFWSTQNVRNLLEALFARDTSFIVGDVSNINGGFFTGHSFHNDGNSFDAQTKNLNGGDHFLGPNSINEIERLLSDESTRPWLRRVLAADSETGDEFKPNNLLALKNRCVQGKTLNNYVKFKINHHHHWHFDTARNPNEIAIPASIDRISFELLGASEFEPLLHPSYPNYRYLKFDNSNETLDYSSYRLVELASNKELYASYKTDASGESYSDDFVEIHRVSDGIVYRIKSESIGMNLPSSLPQYGLIAIAVSKESGKEGYCSSQQVNILNTVEDCNRDGIANDLAFRTTEGGIVQFGITIPEEAVIAYGARVCGNTTISEKNLVIEGNQVLVENVTIGDTCEDITITGNTTISANSQLCTGTVFGDNKENFGSLTIDGSSFVSIRGSHVFGDTYIGGESFVEESLIAGDSIMFEDSHVLNNGKLFGAVYATENTYINNSEVNGYLKVSPEDLYYERVNIYGAGINANSFVWGSGILRGYMHNARFQGTGNFMRASGDYIMLSLHLGGSITSGGRASGVGTVIGDIYNGGVASFRSSNFFVSTLNAGESIGAGGVADCFSYLFGGSHLTKYICDQVYNQHLSPNVMNIYDWRAGEPWPTGPN